MEILRQINECYCNVSFYDNFSCLITSCISSPVADKKPTGQVKRFLNLTGQLNSFQNYTGQVKNCSKCHRAGQFFSKFHRARSNFENYHRAGPPGKFHRWADTGGVIVFKAWRTIITGQDTIHEMSVQEFHRLLEYPDG